MVDATLFGWPGWTLLAIARIIAGGLFGLLAWYAAPPRAAFLALLWLFSIPIGFFLFSDFALAHIEIPHHAIAVTTAYIYLPFIVAAGISLFPLSVLEIATIGLPLIGITVWISLSGGPVGHAYDFGAVWELCLITGIAGLAAITQLGSLAASIEKAAHDPLTSLLTRRFGEQILEILFQIAVRSNAPLTLLFIDLDRFKDVNDRFGHEAGDRVLAVTAACVQHILRHQDITVRWGGEEFLVILPNTDSHGVDAIIDRLAQNGLGLRPDGVLQTASIGVAERKRDNAADWAALAKIADQRMYRAKQSGRNCVVSFEEASRRLFPSSAAPAPNVGETMVSKAVKS